MGGTAIYIGHKRIHGNKWAEKLGVSILAVKMNNGKLAEKLGSIWINNNNIFHKLFSLCC
jgi:hypothetical protein